MNVRNTNTHDAYINTDNFKVQDHYLQTDSKLPLRTVIVSGN